MESEAAIKYSMDELVYDNSLIGLGGCILASVVVFLIFLSLILFIAYGKYCKWESTSGTNYRLVACFGYNLRPIFDRVHCSLVWKKHQDPILHTYEKPVDATGLPQSRACRGSCRYAFPSCPGSGDDSHENVLHECVRLTLGVTTNEDTAGPSGLVPRCITKSLRQSNAQMALNSPTVCRSSLRFSKRSRNMRAFFEKFPFRRSMANRKSLPNISKSSELGLLEADFKERPLPPVPTTDSKNELFSRHRSKSVHIPRGGTREADFFDVTSASPAQRRPTLPSSAERKASSDFRQMSSLVTTNSHEMLEFASFSSDNTHSLAMFRRHVSSRSTNTDSDNVAVAEKTRLHMTRSFSVDQPRYLQRPEPRNLRRSRSLDLRLNACHEAPDYVKIAGEPRACEIDSVQPEDSSRADASLEQSNVVFTKLTENPGYGKLASPTIPTSSRIESMYARIPDDFRSQVMPLSGRPDVSSTPSGIQARQIPKRPRNSGLPPIPVVSPANSSPLSTFGTNGPQSGDRNYARASSMETNYERIGTTASAKTRRPSDQFSSFRSTSSSGSRPYARITDIISNVDATF